MNIKIESFYFGKIIIIMVFQMMKLLRVLINLKKYIQNLIINYKSLNILKDMNLQLLTWHGMSQLKDYLLQGYQLIDMRM